MTAETSNKFGGMVFEMDSCPSCGGAIRPEDLLAEMGDLLTYRCARCGKETWTLICRVLPPELRDETRVRAVVRWTGDVPTAQELIGLRAVVPAFHNLGLGEVKETVREKRNWVLGEFPRRYALAELNDLVKQHGLSLQLIECAIKPNITSGGGGM